MYILLQKGRNVETKEQSSMSASPRRVVTSVTSRLTDLAAAAGTEPRQLALLSDKLLAELCKENKLSLTDRVNIEAYVARVRAEKLSVGEVAVRQDWLEAESRAWTASRHFSASADPFAALVASFEAKARGGHISYVLYAKDASFGRYLFACLLLNVPQNQRLATLGSSRTSLLSLTGYVW